MWYRLCSYECVFVCTQIGAGGMIQMLLMIHATEPTMTKHMAGTMEMPTTTNNIKTGTQIHLCSQCFCTCWHLSNWVFMVIMVARGREGYDDQWRYYPGYDSSFDDDYRRRDQYPDDFDRRSVHSEQSAHSVHSSQSQHSGFSSRSQQVCVWVCICVCVCVCMF